MVLLCMYYKVFLFKSVLQKWAWYPKFKKQIRSFCLAGKLLPNLLSLAFRIAKILQEIYLE